MEVCYVLNANSLQHGLQVLTSSAASSAIAALSPGGVLMQTGTQQAINRKHVPPLSSFVQQILAE